MLPPGESAHGFFYFRTGHRSGSTCISKDLAGSLVGQGAVLFRDSARYSYFAGLSSVLGFAAAGFALGAAGFGFAAPWLWVWLLSGFAVAGAGPSRLTVNANNTHGREPVCHSRSAGSPGDLVDHILPLDHLAENCVLAVQVRRGDFRDEELAASRVRTRIRHSEAARPIERQRRVELVGITSVPPVPYPVGSPPWIMNPGMTR